MKSPDRTSFLVQFCVDGDGEADIPMWQFDARQRSGSIRATAICFGTLERTHQLCAIPQILGLVNLIVTVGKRG